MSLSDGVDERRASNSVSRAEDTEGKMSGSAGVGARADEGAERGKGDTETYGGHP